MLTVWVLCYTLTRDGVVQCERHPSQQRCTERARVWYAQARGWVARSRLDPTEPLYVCFSETLMVQR